MHKRSVIASLLALGIFALSTGASAQERACREFTRNIMIGGEEVEAYGTACLQPDGTWKITPSNEVRSNEAPPQVAQKELPVIYEERPLRVQPRIFVGIGTRFGHRGHHRRHRHYYGGYGYKYGHYY